MPTENPDPGGGPAPEERKDVDPAQLLEGADRLEAIGKELRTARLQVEQLRFSHVGHQGIDEALGRFADHMSGELAQIAETMRSTVEELRMAGEAYTEIELMTDGGPAAEA